MIDVEEQMLSMPLHDDETELDREVKGTTIRLAENCEHQKSKDDIFSGSCDDNVSSNEQIQQSHSEISQKDIKFEPLAPPGEVLGPLDNSSSSEENDDDKNDINGSELLAPKSAGAVTTMEHFKGSRDESIEQTSQTGTKIPPGKIDLKASGPSDNSSSSEENNDDKNDTNGSELLTPESAVAAAISEEHFEGSRDESIEQSSQTGTKMPPGNIDLKASGPSDNSSSSEENDDDKNDINGSELLTPESAVAAAISEESIEQSPPPGTKMPSGNIDLKAPRLSGSKSCSTDPPQLLSSETSTTDFEHKVHKPSENESHSTCNEIQSTEQNIQLQKALSESESCSTEPSQPFPNRATAYEQLMPLEKENKSTDSKTKSTEKAVLISLVQKTPGREAEESYEVALQTQESSSLFMASLTAEGANAMVESKFMGGIAGVSIEKSETAQSGSMLTFDSADHLQDKAMVFSAIERSREESKIDNVIPSKNEMEQQCDNETREKKEKSLSPTAYTSSNTDSKLTSGITENHEKEIDERNKHEGEAAAMKAPIEVESIEFVSTKTEPIKDTSDDDGSVQTTPVEVRPTEIAPTEANQIEGEPIGVDHPTQARQQMPEEQECLANSIASSITVENSRDETDLLNLQSKASTASSSQWTSLNTDDKETMLHLQLSSSSTFSGSRYTIESTPTIEFLLPALFCTDINVKPIHHVLPNVTPKSPILESQDVFHHQELLQLFSAETKDSLTDESAAASTVANIDLPPSVLRGFSTAPTEYEKPNQKKEQEEPKVQIKQDERMRDEEAKMFSLLSLNSALSGLQLPSIMTYDVKAIKKPSNKPADSQKIFYV